MCESVGVRVRVGVPACVSVCAVVCAVSDCAVCDCVYAWVCVCV